VAVSPLHAERPFEILLTNGVKHGGPDDLTISADSNASHSRDLQITVADDRVGIAGTDRSRAFKRLQRFSLGRADRRWCHQVSD
jgi:signal transduction histidine kinase